MDSKLAKRLLPFVNDNNNQTDLALYAEYRIEYLKNELVKAADIKTVTLLQGQIAEVRRLINLRDEVRGKAEDNLNG